MRKTEYIFLIRVILIKVITPVILINDIPGLKLLSSSKLPLMYFILPFPILRSLIQLCKVFLDTVVQSQILQRNPSIKVATGCTHTTPTGLYNNYILSINQLKLSSPFCARYWLLYLPAGYSIEPRDSELKYKLNQGKVWRYFGFRDLIEKYCGLILLLPRSSWNLTLFWPSRMVYRIITVLFFYTRN